MYEDFEDTVFGQYHNRRNKDSFIELLASQGWKYFQVKNLNEFFSIYVEKYGTDDLSSDSSDSNHQKEQDID